MENRSKDGIWELQVLSTCSMNSQSLPLLFLELTYHKKRKIGVKIGYDYLGCIPLTVWVILT